MSSNRYKVIQALAQFVTFNTSTTTLSTRTVNSTDIMLYATSDCYVSFGSSPTATKFSGSLFIPSGTYFDIVSNPGDNISVIGDTSAGKLYV